MRWIVVWQCVKGLAILHLEVEGRKAEGREDKCFLWYEEVLASDTSAVRWSCCYCCCWKGWGLRKKEEAAATVELHFLWGDSQWNRHLEVCVLGIYLLKGVKLKTHETVGGDGMTIIRSAFSPKRSLCVQVIWSLGGEMPSLFGKAHRAGFLGYVCV